MMKFEIVKKDMTSNTNEKYFTNDKSFDCVPAVNVDINLAIAYLNLGVDSEDMCIKCLWGFSPMESWKEEKLCVPKAEEGVLKLVGEYESGLTWRIDDDNMWESFFDKNSGWYCIGNNTCADMDKAVNIIDNMIAVLDANDELKAIWVKPEFV